jgi:hypothetical protein
MTKIGIRTLVIALLVLGWVCPHSAQAQESVIVGAEVFFYGDNTEFSNPFREGETLFGNAARVAVATDLGDRATLTGGMFGNRRYGSDRTFDLVRPVITLDIRAGASRFTFGTLAPPRSDVGPDRGGPHGLLPPIQAETFSFTRWYEAGLQWRYRTPRVAHEFWLDWQRLNTPEAREAFDVGVVGKVGLTRRVALGYQGHLVHHGGQQHANGPVSDSWVAAPGLVI